MICFKYIQFIYGRTSVGIDAIKGVHTSVFIISFALWNNISFCKTGKVCKYIVLSYITPLRCRPGFWNPCHSVKVYWIMDPWEQLSCWWIWRQLCEKKQIAVPHRGCQGCSSPVPSPFSQPSAGRGNAYLAAALAAPSCHVSQWVLKPAEVVGVRMEGPGQSQGGAEEGAGPPGQARREEAVPFPAFSAKELSAQLSWRLQSCWGIWWHLKNWFKYLFLLALCSLAPLAESCELPVYEKRLKICTFMQKLAFRFAHLYIFITVCFF